MAPTDATRRRSRQLPNVRDAFQHREVAPHGELRGRRCSDNKRCIIEERRVENLELSRHESIVVFDASLTLLSCRFCTPCTVIPRFLFTAPPCIHCVSKKNGTLRLIWHNFTNSQHLLMIFGRERPYSIFSWSQLITHLF